MFFSGREGSNQVRLIAKPSRSSPVPLSGEVCLRDLLLSSFWFILKINRFSRKSGLETRAGKYALIHGAKLQKR
jgi:hypothetical protein